MAETSGKILASGGPSGTDREASFASCHNSRCILGQQQLGGVLHQRKPKTPDDVVAYTLKLELYLKGKPASAASVIEEETEVAAVRTHQDQVIKMLQSIMKRMYHLEASAVSPCAMKEID